MGTEQGIVLFQRKPLCGGAIHRGSSKKPLHGELVFLKGNGWQKLQPSPIGNYNHPLSPTTGEPPPPIPRHIRRNNDISPGGDGSIPTQNPNKYSLGQDYRNRRTPYPGNNTPPKKHRPTGMIHSLEEDISTPYPGDRG